MDMQLTAEEDRQATALLDGVEYKLGYPLTTAQRATYKRLRVEAKQRERDAVARAAFYGDYGALNDYLMAQHGYHENGVWYSAQGCSLSEMIAWVRALDNEQFRALVAKG